MNANVWSCLSAVLVIIKVGVAIDYPWDFFVYTQEWTPSVCIDAKKDCSIPPQVQGWTVHGLWPSKFGQESPNYCRPNLKFNWTDIEPLKSNLTAQWPNVFADTKADDFWRHEWDKHGTCAVTLNATGTEYLFFKKALELNTQLGITQVLKSFGVVPTNETGYSIGDITKMIEKHYGQAPKFNCGFDGKTKRQLLSQMELCFDKKFQLMKCENGHNVQEGECKSSDPAYILPLTMSTSHRQEQVVKHQQISVINV